MRERERGAVTIEATLCLTAFMFAIVTLLSAIDICLAQARIGVAIDATAKEISQYSYLYGLTGLNSIKKELKNQGSTVEDQIDNTSTNINNIFNAIQDLGDKAGSTNITDPKQVTAAWNSIKSGAGNIKASAGQINSVADSIKDDPKSFIFGIVKLASSDALDYATSKLIAEPVAKGMVQKHLKNFDDQSPEAFLKGLRIVPDASGSFLNGLDFSDSSLFMYGSDEIRIVVKYKIKIIPLLPIKSTFTFRQTAITKGWLGGDATESVSMEESLKKQYESNSDSLWLSMDVNDRAAYIKNRELAANSGYCKIKDKYDIDAYNPVTKDFMMIASTNPLFTDKDAEPKTAKDITDDEIKATFDRYCDKLNAQTSQIDKITYLDKKSNQKQTDDDLKRCTKTLVIVVPDDEGVKERYQEYAEKYNSDGVKIEIVSGYGKGASKTEVKSASEQQPNSKGEN